MANHYKKIKKAKAVVDCSSPKGYNKKQCGCRVVKVPQCTPPPPPTCTSRSTSPYPSESRSSRPVVPTRFCEFQTRHSLPPTCKRQDFVPCRSNSRPASALGPLVTPILLQKRNDLSKHKVGKIRATKSITKEKKTEKKSDSASYTKQPMKTNKENQENEPNAENYTPKTEKVASGKEKTTMNGIMEPQDCEYAYFLLKITEDILRNNIYEDKELTILFQSHIDANKGRLDEDRMRAQIEELKRQLCLPLQRKDLCYCNKDVQASNCTYPNCQADCLCSNPCCPKQDKQTDKQVKENLPSLEERDEKPEMKEMDVDVSEPVKDTQQLDEIEEEPAQGKDENEEETKSCVCEESVTSGPEQNKQSVTSPISQGKGSPVSASRGTLDETVEAKQKESPKQEKTWADSHLGGIHSIHSVPETQEPLNELNGKGECTEPELCQQPPEKDPNEKNKLRKPPSKISYSPPCGTSVNSTYKMVPKDQKDRSQTVFYHLDNSQHCYCSVTLQKTALKIQVDDTNEEYVLVDGPVCMPRSMLESKTITVLIQNVSSIVLSSSETSGETQPEILSQVNLFQRSNGPLAANMDSISGQLQKQGNVGSNSSTKMEKECAKEPILKKAIKNYENQKSSLPSNNSQDEVSPNVQTREPSEREERPPATIQEESQHRKPLQDCGPKKCGAQLPTVCSAPCSVVLPTQTDISSAPKPDEMSNKDRTVSDVNFVEKKISSSLKKKVPSSEHGTGAQGSTGDDQVEAKKSSMSTGDGSDEKRSIHSTHAEDPVSGVGSSAVCEEKSSDILPGDAPSKKRYSDFAKKYHYLLVDASTSTSSCKVSSILKMPSKSHRDTPPQLLPSPLQLTPPQLPPPQSLSPTSPPPQTPPEVSPDESPRHSNAQNEYMLLLNEEYEADKVHLQSPLETVQHEEEEVEMPTTYNQPYVSEIKTESSEAPQPPPVTNIDYFKYPSISPGQDPNELTYPARRTSESINDRMSDIESFRRPSLMIEDEVRTVQPMESYSTTPTLLKKESPSMSSSVMLKPHEGLKVRYSMSRDVHDQPLGLVLQSPGNQEIMNKLDDLPSIDQDKSKDDNIAAINEKMKEFRKIEDDDNANRRFQITNPENFEIRRVSILDRGQEEEDEDKSKKKKSTCCGIGQKDKKKRSLMNNAPRESTNPT